MLQQASITYFKVQNSNNRIININLTQNIQ